MVRSCFFLFLLLFCAPIFAQSEVYAKILNDPKIIWAAEYEMEFLIEPEFVSIDSFTQSFFKNHSFVLKILTNTKGGLKTEDALFSKILLAHCQNTKIPVFERPYDGNSLSDSMRMSLLRNTLSIGQMDSLSVLDVETGIEKTVALKPFFDSNRIKSLRILGLLYYDKAADQFDFYASAFAPVFYVQSNSSYEGGYFYSPFWFKTAAFSSKKQKHSPSLPSRNITWARRVESGSELVFLDSLYRLKDFERPILQNSIDRARTDEEYKIMNPLLWKNIAFQERETLFFKRDTIVTFDTETYEEVIETKDTEISGNQIMQIQTKTDIFWDAKKEALIVRLFAFAPIYHQRDEQGNFRFWRPVFWREVER